MGGYGSGNWRAKHSTTSDFPSLDIRAFQRAGYLVPGHNHTNQWIHETHTETVTTTNDSDNTLIITYRHGNSKADTYTFKFEWMNCHLGGKRAFFLCPNCGKRACLLYAIRDWGCRHCHDLTYACQGERAEARAARQANKIRRRLDWHPGPLAPVGGKPMGMHRNTFDHLAFKQMRYASKVLDSMAKALNIVI